MRIICLALIAISAPLICQAEISLTHPKPNAWVNIGEAKSFNIMGSLAKAMHSEKVVLRVGDREFLTTANKQGKFSFDIDSDLFKPFHETKLRIQSHQKGRAPDEKVFSVFCCSTNGQGTIAKVPEKLPAVIEIKSAASEVNGIRFQVLKGDHEKTAQITVVSQVDVEIDLEKYLPLSTGLAFDLSGFKTNPEVIVGVPNRKAQPRDSNMRPVSVSEWEPLSKRKWNDIDFSKLEIVVLRTDLDSSWSEVAISNRTGNLIEFILSKSGDPWYERYVLALKLPPTGSK